MNNTNKKGKKIISATVITLVLVILWYIGQHRIDSIEKQGVYSICEVYEYTQGSRGVNQNYVYYYGGREYNVAANVSFQDKVNEPIHTRFNIAFMPDDPANCVILERIPSWYTLKAPSEGWKQKPTESELRKMMVQDSIKRGLK